MIRLFSFYGTNRYANAAAAIKAREINDHGVIISTPMYTTAVTGPRFEITCSAVIRLAYAWNANCVHYGSKEK